MVQEDENMVIKAIRKVGVNIDKGALIKALQYDRNQYTKGYEDGKNEVLDKIKAEIERLPIPDTAIGLVDEILVKYKAESEHKRW